MNNLTKITIQQSLLEQLLEANKVTLFTSALLAAVLAYMERQVISTNIAVTWLSLILLVNLLRFIATRHHRMHPTNDNNVIQSRLMQFRIGVIASGFLWGMSSIFMSPQNDPQHQMFVVYVVTGLVAGGAVAYSVDIVSAMAYTTLVIIPLLIRLFLDGSELSLAMGIGGILFLVFMLLSIRNINRNFLDNITLRHDAVERESEIKQLAFYDPLTNLPNRRLLLDRLDHALSICSRTGRRGALLFLDLDHFKMLNDTLGHDMGDLLLKKVAERLQGCVRESDTVARLGGDEFVVMLEDLSEELEEASEHVKKVADLIIETLNIPYKLNIMEYSSTSSIGIALFGDHGNTHDELLKHADIAMYQAKNAGRNAARLFDFHMRTAGEV